MRWKKEGMLPSHVWLTIAFWWLHALRHLRIVI